jgi:hypothetical protein
MHPSLVAVSHLGSLVQENRTPGSERWGAGHKHMKAARPDHLPHIKSETCSSPDLMDTELRYYN